MKPAVTLIALVVGLTAAVTGMSGTLGAASDARSQGTTNTARSGETTVLAPRQGLVLTSSSAYLAEGFAWAKRMALGKVHPNNGGCYQAALPDRGG